MPFHVRESKFRHIFGQALKRDNCYDGIRITRTSWESTYCAVSTKFVAVITEAAGGGSFLVMPLTKTGRVNIDNPMVSGHKGAVLDIAWCPHNDNVIASASDDCTIKVWQIPDEGLTANLTEPAADLCGHLKRVTLLVWHPSAMNVLASASSDNSIIMWNVGTCEAKLQIDIGDQVWSAAFNFDGSKIACSSKDKTLRVLDSHSGEVLQSGKCHMGSKPSQVTYLKDGQIFTTGFSRMSSREYSLWNEKDLSSCVVTEEIDSSNGVNFIFADPDTGVIYLAGKGDSNIRFFEVTKDAPFVHYLSLFQSNTPQRGMGWIPKRGVDVTKNEIARFYKLHNNGLCEVIPFTVPRKSELFQDDLFPETASDQPAISADDFFDGKNAKPLTISLKDGVKSSNKAILQVQKKSNVLDKMPANRASQAVAAEVAAPALPPGFDPQGILDDMRKLKLIVKAHERRIKTLEERLSQYESGEEDVEDA